MLDPDASAETEDAPNVDNKPVKVNETVAVEDKPRKLRARESDIVDRRRPLVTTLKFLKLLAEQPVVLLLHTVLTTCS